MYCNTVILWASLVLFIVRSNPVSSASYKFTNVKCEDHNPTFAQFKECRLSVLRRGVVGLTVYAELYKSPVTNALVNVAFYKRGNGYNPYLFNVSADVCAYFEERNKYPLLQIIFASFVKNSNLNHTCPYSDSLVVKDLVLEESSFRLIPIPNGQYMIKIKIYAYKDLKSTIQVFFARSE